MSDRWLGVQTVAYGAALMAPLVALVLLMGGCRG